MRLRRAAKLATLTFLAFAVAAAVGYAVYYRDSLETRLNPSGKGTAGQLFFDRKRAFEGVNVLTGHGERPFCRFVDLEGKSLAAFNGVGCRIFGNEALVVLGDLSAYAIDLDNGRASRMGVPPAFDPFKSALVGTACEPEVIYARADRALHTEEGKPENWFWRLDEHVEQILREAEAENLRFSGRLAVPMPKVQLDLRERMRTSSFDDASVTVDPNMPTRAAVNWRAANVLFIVDRVTGNVLMARDFKQRHSDGKPSTIYENGADSVDISSTGDLFILNWMYAYGFAELQFSAIERYSLGEQKPMWRYIADPAYAFKVEENSGGAVKRLPNGGALVTDIARGSIFEVSPDRRVVWEWFSGIARGGPETLVETSRLPAPAAQRLVETIQSLAPKKP